jgi:hypothetical protein
VDGTVSVGTAWYADEQYHARATKSGYMVVYGPDKFRTEDATTSVVVRAVADSPEGGFGLAIFGEMGKKKELEDYCFVIRPGGTPLYRIVMHRGGQETVIKDWASTSYILSGTSANQIEVRTSGTSCAFYINGRYVTTIEADNGYAVGVAGLYTSGTEEVTFDDLRVYKLKLAEPKASP